LVNILTSSASCGGQSPTNGATYRRQISFDRSAANIEKASVVPHAAEGKSNRQSAKLFMRRADAMDLSPFDRMPAGCF
jgi:hypothetical protein